MAVPMEIHRRWVIQEFRSFPTSLSTASFCRRKSFPVRASKYRGIHGLLKLVTKETPYAMPRKEMQPDARAMERWHKRSPLLKHGLQCRNQKSSSYCCLRHCISSTRTCAIPRGSSTSIEPLENLLHLGVLLLHGDQCLLDPRQALGLVGLVRSACLIFFLAKMLDLLAAVLDFGQT